ncbi:MAG TPA: glycerate kinase [Propionibacteriaceae bacterium]
MKPGGHLLLAPDKFKGSLSAAAVARHLQVGIHRVVPETDLRLVPVADGGEGTVEAAVAAGFRRISASVTGSLGEPVLADIAVRGHTAVVELAQANGLELTGRSARRPLLASSFGTGELIRRALDLGCRTIVLGVGGSDTTDGGAGMVSALGARLSDVSGEPNPGGGAALRQLHQLSIEGLDPRLAATTVVVACDVDNPLLGPQGAASVFAPQKGALPAEVLVLEEGLRRWSHEVSAVVGRDWSTTAGAGAAGGVAFAALAMLGAQLRPGIEVMLEMSHFTELLGGARLVVTGEGSLDEQSLGGKVPVGVARAAVSAGTPVVAVAGRTTLSAAVLRAAGFAGAYTLQELEPDLERCMADAGVLVEQLGQRIAQDWLLPPPD